MVYCLPKDTKELFWKDSELSCPQQKKDGRNPDHLFSNLILVF